MAIGLEKEIKGFFSVAGRSELFEITYAYTVYQDRFFNRTLFYDYGRSSSDDTSVMLISKVRKRLEEDIAYLYACITNDHDASDWRNAFYVKTLDYTRRIYEMIWWAVPFEAQKWLPEDDYTVYGMEECLQQVEKMDKEIFGMLVSKKSREVSRSECLLLNMKRTFADRLSDTEITEYVAYAQLLKMLPNYKEDICHLDLSISLLDDKIFDCLIHRDVYIELFTLVFDFYKLHIPVRVDERNSIYDGSDALYIPDSDAYMFLSLRKVLNLIIHEIETHYIVLHNTNQILGGIKGANNLSREEGLATFQEFLLTGNELADIDISSSLPIILMGELLSGEKYLDFLKLYRKLHGITATGIDRLLRAKRNYPLRGKGVQHKDVAYSRGVYQVRKYLLDGGKFSDLFLAKVSFEDLAILAKSTQGSKLILPKQITMRLVFVLLDGSGHQTYEKSIQDTIKKYPFIEELLLASFTAEEQSVFSKIEKVIRDSLQKG